VQSIETYSHLIPGANVAYVDCLDVKSEKKPPAPAQPRQQVETEIPLEVVDLIGGGGWTRTNDLRIMRFRPLGTPTLIQALSCGSEPDRPAAAA